MTSNPYKKLSLILAALLLVCIAFTAGYILLTTNHDHPAPLVESNPTAADNNPPPVTAATLAVSPPDTPVAPAEKSPEKIPGESLTWDNLDNGCTITQAAGKLHIAGTTALDGWDHWNGTRTAREFPEGDFTASVDFMIPQFSGTGNALTYLRVSGDGDSAVGVLCQPTVYQLQCWAPRSFTPQIPVIGDEKTTFHRMTLKYENATQTASGWIDDRPIGTLTAPLPGKRRFWLVANTDHAGVNIDIRFENFTITIPPAGKLP